jgi:ketosteroid isomerase-like protein
MEKRLVLMMGMAVCLEFSGGCQRPVGLSEADRTAIRRADQTDRSMKMMIAKDWKGDLDLYAEDAIQMPPNQVAVQGKAAILAWDEAFPPFSNFQEKSLEVEGQGNMAYDRGTYSMTVTLAGKEPIEEHGKYLTIWRKQADGSWKISRTIYNSDLPLPAPEKPAVEHKRAGTRRHAPRRKRTLKARSTNPG